MTKIVRTLWLCLLLPVGVLGQEREFSSYGYIDLEFEYDSEKDVSTFDIHHFNLISTYSFDQFRVFSEVEWEHGPKLEADASDSEGEVALERAWFEYLHSDRLKFRAGKFLTPFGIYNLVHDATPTFLTTSLPSIYNSHNPFGLRKERLYAKFYTGLQVLGAVRTTSGVRFRYTLGLGNGRGDTQFSSDNDTNKSLIARTQLGFRQFDLGLSLYTDRSETGMSGLAEARERATGADLTFEKDGLKIQSEYARFRLERAAGSGFQSAESYYAQISYQVNDYVTPIVRFDRFDPDRGSTDDGDRLLLLGLNVSPHPQIYLKTEVQFRSSDVPGVKSSRLYISSVSVAF